MQQAQVAQALEQPVERKLMAIEQNVVYRNVAQWEVENLMSSPF